MSTSINPQPILFLDIDGPLVTNDSGGVAQTRPDTVVFKPEAVHFVNELVRIAGAKIVVISDWAGYCMDDDQYDRSFVPDRLIRAFRRNKLVHDEFHPVWSHAYVINPQNKKHLEDSGKYARGWRPYYWLQSQGAHSHYAILDDSICLSANELEMGQHDPNRPLSRSYIEVKRSVGITQHNFEQALALLTEGVDEVGA